MKIELKRKVEKKRNGDDDNKNADEYCHDDTGMEVDEGR